MWVTATPNPTYGSGVSGWAWEFVLPKMKHCDILWQIAITSAQIYIQLYSGLHLLPYNSFIFDFNDLTISSTLLHFLKRKSAFGLEIYLSTLTTFHYLFRLIEPLWIFMWVLLLLLIGTSSTFLCKESSLLHVSRVVALFDWAEQSKHNKEIQSLNLGRVIFGLSHRLRYTYPVQTQRCILSIFL